jgi:uncharacterized protein YceK
VRKLVIVLIVLILVGCGPTATSTKAPTLTPTKLTTPLTYIVTRETGWYATARSDNYKSTLWIGIKVKPADGALYLDCDTFVTHDVKITTCHVEIISTGETGWVLLNAIRRL